MVTTVIHTPKEMLTSSPFLPMDSATVFNKYLSRVVVMCFKRNRALSGERARPWPHVVAAEG